MEKMGEEEIRDDTEISLLDNWMEISVIFQDNRTEEHVWDQQWSIHFFRHAESEVPVAE